MKHHLLIAEDEPDLADRLAVAAREAGWEVSSARDAKDLVRQADTLLPTAVVLAVEFAGERGWALINLLKRNPVTRGSWLVLTGAGESIAQAFAQHQRLATRADAYLPRPYEPAALIAQLGAQTQQSRQDFVAQQIAIRARSAPPFSARSVILWTSVAAATLAVVAALVWLR